MAVPTAGWPDLVAGRTALVSLFTLEAQAVLVPWCLYFYSCRLNKLLHVIDTAHFTVSLCVL